MRKFFLFIAFVVFSLAGRAQINQKYMMPPASIAQLADATLPIVQFSRDGRYMLTLKSAGFETIEQVAQPVLGLAGLKVNAANHSLEPSNTGSYKGITIKDLSTGESHELSGLPDQFLITRISWSPDGTKFAFANKRLEGIDLWIADLSDYSAHKLTDRQLNFIYGNPLQWHPSGNYLLAQAVPADLGDVPAVSRVPKGPVVQQNLGGVTPSRTYQYLLQDPDDEKFMDYYLTSELLRINLDGTTQSLYKESIFKSANFSPDGKYLLVQTIERPYSYLVPISAFPYNTTLLDEGGNIVRELNKAPLADKTPIAYDAVAAGPRSYQWRRDVSATIIWAEALDGGDSRKETDFRDAIYYLNAPFNSEPGKLYSTKYRYRGINWINNNYAIVNEGWRKTRASVMTLINPKDGSVIREISNRSTENAYDDPGRFVFSNQEGESGTVLTSNEKGLKVFTISSGASPEGDRPFLMKWDMLNDKTDTLFKSKAPYYESPVFFDNNGYLFFSRESVETAPNYFKLELKKKGKESVLTAFADPYPALRNVTKTQLSYPRSDGVTLTGTLYLPDGYKKEDGRLPVLVWAYPREFKSLQAAAQVKGSPYRFPRISWASPIYWVTRGYAVVDNADMPIVGTGKEEPNNTFVEQITDNANSLINYIVDMGIADRNRIAVGGHSYGAFMTANLLAHTGLFAAGIARSGAYNRTLTPFGFQNEARTFWQAPEIYGGMSPFFYADKIKTPLLLIHGIADDNSGTFPIQSERLYSAVKGHGGIIRLVMLPDEFHSYRSRESIMHMLWEQDQWLEKWVKEKIGN